ncbi:hypothetical protein ZIOFF_005037 [Zingiber officinale]|uniref:Protein kinase domain-containing protein n=2 Tax=Zingiber officinale TaxID=94328 RepID=A0A8J5HMZ9_ZINOF|nr:hypothetical protein ZIOFF_005037 [Zingiber officinale]
MPCPNKRSRRNQLQTDSLTSGLVIEAELVEMERGEGSFSFLLGFFFFFLCFSLCCFSSSADTSPQLDQSQVLILVALSNFLPSSFQWNATSHPNPCNWKGVNCSSTSRVAGLDLAGVGLSTAAGFFEELCRLDSLLWLDLSNNTFTSIPESFFSNCSGLSGLQHLNMSYNGLTRLQNFSSFGSLQILDLSRNKLSGDIDLQLDDLAELQSLNLSFNSFDGSIPSLRKANGLRELMLSYNHLAGEIPTEISLHKNLTILDLNWNQISGRIPDELGELTKLEILLLSRNQMNGEIPNTLSMISNLYRFAANQNNFSGAIPSGLTRFVKNLDLSYNQLNGSIPSDFLSSPTLLSLDLTSNRLEGAIQVGSSPRLFRLRLGQNSLSGAIPQTIGSLSGLEYLELDGNDLSSQIPLQIGDIKNLTLLNLASNRMEGELPKELGDLRQLVVLQLQSNSFTGMIPEEVFRLTNLITLNLSQNSLSGAISPAIANLSELTNLDLHGNEFEGPIPDSIRSLTSLIELELGDNRLSGTIPKMPDSITIALNLSHNLFSGPLPSSLGELTQLEILDLSNNDFIGEVPKSFANMKSLTLLDLSNNNLSGTLPDQLTKFATVIISGTEIRNLTDLQNTVSKKKKNSAWIIVVAIVGAVIGLSAVAIVLVLIFPRRFYRVKDEQPQSEESTPQIVSGHLITANDFHRSGIDFSKVMEVVCDPRNIELKTRFSTYYKVVMPNGVSYAVKKLNWSDKVFRVENHEKIGQELEALGMLSSSNIMVPLAYMSIEDDAYLFYEHVYKGTVFDFLHKNSDNVLDWASRHAIMLKVAQGLTFLHGCTQPIILLDLTTKSIKLKSHKEPQIGDIELLRVIDATKSSGSLSAVAGSVGYVPPEYAYTMKVTMAGNVYSFGVILLELLTGKPPVNNGLELARWALNFSTKPAERELMLDSRISKTSLVVRSQMLSVLKVALACVSVAPEGRPKMQQALRMVYNAK